MMSVVEWIRAVVIVVVVTPRHKRPMSSLGTRNANVDNDNQQLTKKATILNKATAPRMLPMMGSGLFWRSMQMVMVSSEDDDDDDDEREGVCVAQKRPGLQALEGMTVVVQGPWAESGQDVVVRDVVVKQAGPDVGNGPEEVGPEEEEEPEEEPEVDEGDEEVEEVGSEEVEEADAGSFALGLELTLLSETVALLSGEGEGVGVGCWS
ncbi:hypothetical protein CDD80_4643 [Ophiocordyceps camponoti-rufipedis]|uniref:Uncharacterized protein n=1 Tax=Ophiocordyceps camponoti-rufipedis TaxID=2004952 RepID=A0A2C5YY57_9HYPO|nr:hypothetical protein CDD80_4643 [Ophiocordyceps camponoti-rufipedis]